MHTDKNMITARSIQETITSTMSTISGLDQHNLEEHAKINHQLEIHDKCIDDLKTYLVETDGTNNKEHNIFREEISGLQYVQADHIAKLAHLNLAVEQLQQEVKWLKMVETSLIACVLGLLALIVIAYI